MHFKFSLERQKLIGQVYISARYIVYLRGILYICAVYCISAWYIVYLRGILYICAVYCISARAVVRNLEIIVIYNFT